MKKCLEANEKLAAQPNPDASRVFGTMVDAGSGCYLRARDLPRAKLRVKRNAPGAARSTSGAPGKDDDASPAFHHLREPTR